MDSFKKRNALAGLKNFDIRSRSKFLVVSPSLAFSPPVPVTLCKTTPRLQSTTSVTLCPRLQLHCVHDFSYIV